MHWASQYVGIPYQRGRRDRQAVDCWGLLCLVYQEQFHVEIPLLLPGTAPELLKAQTQEVVRRWERMDRPFDGCGVLMGQGNQEHHVGIWTDVNGGMVLHAWEPIGVILDSKHTLRARLINSLRFYRFRLCLT